jgi:hypothetical protein
MNELLFRFTRRCLLSNDTHYYKNAAYVFKNFHVGDTKIEHSKGKQYLLIYIKFIRTQGYTNEWIRSIFVL